MEKSGLERNQSLISYGIDTVLFDINNKKTIRKDLGIELNKKIALFAGAFHIPVKNSLLARKAIALLPKVELLGLGSYTREELGMLMNAVDVVLMTSFSEGSPQIIKEALACNCPVVSVPVGDVPSTIEDIPGCYITSYEPDDIAVKLQLALDFGRLTEGRKKIEALGLDAESVAGRILEVYKEVLSL
jgi:glycosyltransferase involved in cell wall biosynthesis